MKAITRHATHVYVKVRCYPKHLCLGENRCAEAHKGILCLSPCSYSEAALGNMQMLSLRPELRLWILQASLGLEARASYIRVTIDEQCRFRLRTEVRPVRNALVDGCSPFARKEGGSQTQQRRGHHRKHRVDNKCIRCRLIVSLADETCGWCSHQHQVFYIWLIVKGTKSASQSMRALPSVIIKIGRRLNEVDSLQVCRSLPFLVARCELHAVRALPKG